MDFGQKRPKIKYLIGQRVILNNEEIGTIAQPETGDWDADHYIWVNRHGKGYASAYSLENVKPLPGGQL